MAGRVEGKVAFITGAARGQGRSHAIRLAEEGADIVAVDICHDYDPVHYGLATPDDLALTVKAVEETGRRIVAVEADVRDADALRAAADRGVAELGRLDIVCANAGICTAFPWNEVPGQVWQDIIDTNLTGVWNTMVAGATHLVAGGGGSIICTGSTASLKGLPFLAPYVAAKHGIVGIARSMANELGTKNVRVNVVVPAGVDTPMNERLDDLHRLVDENPELGAIYTNALDIRYLDPGDVSDTVLFLASDEAKYITGLVLTIDGGNTIR